MKNQFQGTDLKSSIIGVGLNVNQINFNELSRSSLKNITSKEYNLDSLLESIIKTFEIKFENYLKKNTDDLLHLYLSKLFMFNKKCSYRLYNSSTVINATNMGVNYTGKLRLKLESNQIQEFDIKVS